MDTILEKYNSGRSTRQIRFFSHHWTSSIMHPPSPCIWRERRRSKGAAPSFIWETRGAVDSPKCPASRAEEGRSGEHRMLSQENKEQPVASWGAISEVHLDRTFRLNGYNLARERTRSGRKVNKTETHGIVLRRHFLGEDPVSSLVIGHHPLCRSRVREISRREDSPFFASGDRERDVKARGRPELHFQETRGAVDSPKCPANQAEKGRFGARSMLGRGEQRAASSRLGCNFGKHSGIHKPNSKSGQNLLHERIQSCKREIGVAEGQQDRGTRHCTSETLLGRRSVSSLDIGQHPLCRSHIRRYHDARTPSSRIWLLRQ
ncbi:hypothetical protein CEXT_430471 [Caerostris extrusa]|uniref:Uncharacterized protein n=1 Tax=Caerostris extrusa TaxID=172846 RepID=A0AAV4XMJ9_CAEEX|nr:hypothetical protein CEXT_430471 [Caerostris extrusa]